MGTLRPVEEAQYAFTAKVASDGHAVLVRMLPSRAA